MGLGTIVAWAKPIRELWSLPGYIDDGVSWAIILETVGAAMTLLDWILVAAGLACATYAFWPERRTSTAGATDVRGPAGDKRAWEIAGARKKHFTLKEAAALIAGADPIFPLTGLARDEYDTLCQDVESGTLPVLVPSGKEFAPIYGGRPVVQKLALKAHKRFHEDILQKVRVEREPLRDYIRSQVRPVPEFLIERFDSTATLKPRVHDR